MIFPQQFVDPSRCNIRSLNRTVSPNPAHSGRQIKTRLGNSQRWQLDIDTPILRYEKAMELYSFVVSAGGRFANFKLANPLPPLAQAIAGIKVLQSAPERATAVELTGLGNNRTKCLLAGDFVQFANHGKVYMVLNQVDASTTGTGTVQLAPPLHTALGVDVALTSGANVMFNVELSSDENDLALAAKNQRETPLKLSFKEVW
jgi:hypothetical protein